MAQLVRGHVELMLLRLQLGELTAILADSLLNLLAQ